MITKVVWVDNNVSNSLFPDHHDHLGGVQPLQQPGVEPDQGDPQEVIFWQRCTSSIFLL